MTAFVAALLALGLALVAPQVATAAATTTATPEPVEVVLFWGDGCPRCDEQHEWLEPLVAAGVVTVREHEVWADAAGRAEFVAAGRALGFEASAVPTTVVGERVWIGWTEPIASDLRAAIDAAAEGREPPPGVYGTAGAGTCDEAELQCSGDETPLSVRVPLLGEVSVGDRNLLVATVVIGFIDGVNPCSLWVISVLLAIVLRTGSRRRVLAIGSTFLVVTAAMYGLYMVGIYSALSVVGYLGAVQGVVALAAGVFGVVAVKDYFAFKKGLSFSIADSAKPGIYARVRAAAGHHALVPALAATVALGVAVSLLELPCTAGFPVLWAGLLQANGVGAVEAAGLYVAYMVPYLLDEMLVFGAAVVTMRATRMQERHGQVLKLVAGVTMLVLAGAIVIDPSIMEDPLAALALFAAAMALAAVIHLVTQRVRQARSVEGRGRVAEPERAEV